MMCFRPVYSQGSGSVLLQSLSFSFSVSQLQPAKSKADNIVGADNKWKCSFRTNAPAGGGEDFLCSTVGILGIQKYTKV